MLRLNFSLPFSKWHLDCEVWSPRKTAFSWRVPKECATMLYPGPRSDTPGIPVWKFQTSGEQLRLQRYTVTRHVCVMNLWCLRRELLGRCWSCCLKMQIRSAECISKCNLDENLLVPPCVCLFEVEKHAGLKERLVPSLLGLIQTGWRRRWKKKTTIFAMWLQLSSWSLCLLWRGRWAKFWDVLEWKRTMFTVRRSVAEHLAAPKPLSFLPNATVTEVVCWL